MPRQARLLVDGGCYHILTRGNNRATVFHDEADFQRYGRLIATYFPSRAPQIARLFKPLLRATSRLRSTPSLLVGDLNAGLNPADTEGSPLSGSPRFAELLEDGWVDIWR